jgi:hypothetical protein
VTYCVEQSGGVVFVEAGDGVAEAYGDAACEACGQQEDAPFPAANASGRRCAIVDADRGVRTLPGHVPPGLV